MHQRWTVLPQLEKVELLDAGITEIAQYHTEAPPVRPPTVKPPLSEKTLLLAALI